MVNPTTVLADTETDHCSQKMSLYWTDERTAKSPGDLVFYVKLRRHENQHSEGVGIELRITIVRA